MATIHKPAYTSEIPADAKLMTKGGKTFAQFNRDGKRVIAPLAKDGTKCRIESNFWFVRYEDLDGKIRSGNKRQAVARSSWGTGSQAPDGVVEFPTVQNGICHKSPTVGKTSEVG